MICLFSARSHRSTGYICNVKLSTDCWMKQIIKIGPKKGSIRKSHFEDWHFVFLRWLNIFVMQFTSDCQRGKKKTVKSIFSLLKKLNVYSDSFNVTGFIQFILNTKRPWKGRQKIGVKRWNDSNSWSWFHFSVLQVCSTTQSWIPRNTITLNIKLETNINLRKKAKLDRPPIQRIKWQIGVRSIHHPPPHLPLPLFDGP